MKLARTLTRRRLAASAITATVLVSLTACNSKAVEPFQDSGVAGRDKSPATVLDMPDGFSNVATKCDGPNRVYVIFHSDSAYGSVSVVPNDPRCVKGGGR